MPSLGLLVPARGSGSGNFIRALNYAYRRRTGTAATAPYLSITTDGPDSVTLGNLMRKLAEGGAGMVAFADLSWYCLTPDGAVAAAVVEPWGALQDELAARGPRRNWSVGFIGASLAVASGRVRDHLDRICGHILTLDERWAMEIEQLITRLARVPATSSDGVVLGKAARQLQMAGAEDIVIGASELVSALTLADPDFEFLNLSALHAEAAVTCILADNPRCH